MLRCQSGYGLVAMTFAPHAKGREFDPHYPYFFLCWNSAQLSKLFATLPNYWNPLLRQLGSCHMQQVGPSTISDLKHRTKFVFRSTMLSAVFSQQGCDRVTLSIEFLFRESGDPMLQRSWNFEPEATQMTAYLILNRHVHANSIEA